MDRITLASNIRHCLIIFLFVSFLLAMISSTLHGVVLGALGASALGSSAFLVFSMPNSPVSRNQCILGGYAIAIACGLCAYGMLTFMVTLGIDGSYEYGNGWFHLTAHELFGALAIALASLLMLWFRVPHPPAAGLSLGLVLDVWDIGTLSVIAIALFVLVFIHTLLRYNNGQLSGMDRSQSKHL